MNQRGWEKVSQHREPGVRALVKEFYANLGKQKNLKLRCIPFRERAISQLLKLRLVGEFAKYDQLQESSRFEEIVRELKNGLEQW